MKWWEKRLVYMCDLAHTKGEEVVPEDEPYMIHPNRKLFTVADAADELGISRFIALRYLGDKGAFKDSIGSPITVPEYDMLVDEFGSETETVAKTDKEADEMIDVFTSGEEMALTVNHGILVVGEPAVFFRGKEPENGVKIAEVELETSSGPVMGAAYFNAAEKKLDWKFMTESGDPYPVPEELMQELRGKIAVKYRMEQAKASARKEMGEKMTDGGASIVAEAPASSAKARAIKLASCRHPKSYKEIVEALTQMKKMHLAGTKLWADWVIGKLAAKTKDGREVLISVVLSNKGKMDYTVVVDDAILPLVKEDTEKLTELFRTLWKEIKVEAPVSAGASQSSTPNADDADVPAKRERTANTKTVKDYGVEKVDIKVVKSRNTKPGDVVAKVFMKAKSGKEATFAAIIPYNGKTLMFKDLFGDRKINPKLQPVLSAQVMKVVGGSR